MALPDLPDAVGDAPGSADATPPSAQRDAEPAGSLTRLGELADGKGLPEQPSGDMEGAGRQLHPLPPGLIELYGLLAVLFVLVPEWMAGGALLGFQDGWRGSELPTPSGAWKRLPELRLASLNLAELRQLAHERRLIGYSRQSRQELTTRLLRHLKARP
jgi:hypothetical protein